jgi:hypothetical protein
VRAPLLATDRAVEAHQRKLMAAKQSVEIHGPHSFL